jgi:predicted nuclease with TOPRIM domain
LQGFNQVSGQGKDIEDGYGLETVSIDLKKYLTSEIPSDFSTLFETKESLQNYKRLRDYKSQKEILIRELNRNENRYFNSKLTLDDLKNFNSTLKDQFSRITKNNNLYILTSMDEQLLASSI